MKRLKVEVTVDRPLGYTDKFGNVYPLNYGFVAGVIGAMARLKTLTSLRKIRIS